MTAQVVEAGAPRLHRALGVFDLILLNVTAIVGLRWLSTAALIGPSSLTLWVLGLVTFFLPAALTVLELSSRIPGEGGFYLWVREAFGGVHGFIAGWSLWIGNLAYFPALLLFAAGLFPYVHGGSWLKLPESAAYNIGFGLVVLWTCIGLNILGLERAKWLQNLGGAAIWSVGAMVLVAGALSWTRFGFATPITPAKLIPSFGSIPALATFAGIALAYDGLELGPVMGGEIKDPQRTIPRAILLACIAAALIYIAGTASILAALPAGTINAISGVPQALSAVGARIGFPAFGAVAAGLFTFGQIGGLGAWLTGTARLPFVFGLDRYLPSALGKLHPRFGSPYVALLTQGVLCSLVLIGSLSGSSVREAFAALVDMTLILGFIPLLYMFISLPLLRRRAAGSDRHVHLVPGGLVACWIVGLLGFGTTLLAVIVSTIPPAGSAHPGLFVLKVVGGCSVLVAVGLGFYRFNRARA